jgi:hypothetical protein
VLNIRRQEVTLTNRFPVDIAQEVVNRPEVQLYHMGPEISEIKHANNRGDA